MAKSAAVRSTENLSAQELERKIRDARYSVGEDRFIVTFDSGKEYSFPRSSLEVDDGSGCRKRPSRAQAILLSSDLRPRAIATRFRGTGCSTRRSLHTLSFGGARVRQKRLHNVGATIRKLRRSEGAHAGPARNGCRNDAK